MQQILKRLIPIFILLVAISSANAWTKFPIGNTFFWWIIYALILIFFIIAKKRFFNKQDNSNILILKIYLLWNITCIIRALFVAENYWEWKNLVDTAMVLLLPTSIYVSANKDFIQYAFHSYLKYSILCFLILVAFFYDDAFGQFLAPISILLLLFPVIPTKWKAGLIILYLIVILNDIEARSNIIKFTIPLCLSVIYFIPVSFIKVGKVFETARLVLLIIPIVFFVLGVTGTFNIFKIDKYIKGNYETTKVQNGEIVGGSLTADTRTFLYVEVLQSAFKHNYVLFGRTPARGNDSKSFGAHLADELKTGKMERFSNEVSILNLFTWTGIVGVILYFIIFYKATYLAINKSNNIFMKIIGLYVAFRWLYAWVEDFSRIDLYYCFLWFLIGMCYSTKFRQMNNQEMKVWILGIFEKKYRVAYKRQLREQQLKPLIPEKIN
jgi:hypothetical protein